MKQIAPSAYDEFVHFIHKPCYHRVLVIYQSPNQRWSHFARGCTVCGVSWVQSMQTICYPALRDAVTIKKAAYNCIRVAPLENPQRPERMCKRLNYVVCYNNRADHIKDFQYPSNEPFGMDFFKLKQAQRWDLASLFPLEYSRVCKVEFLCYFVERSFGLKLRYGHRYSPLLMSIGKS
jgi:hypothetical protein